MSKDSDAKTDLFGNPWSPPRDPRGRKQHRPTPQGREIIAQLKATGASDDDVALQVGLSVPTLRKYYFRELEHGVSLARNVVLQKLYTKATQGDGNVAAMKAFLAETAKGERAELMRAPRPRSEKPLGKKEQRQQAAEEVGGMLAPGAPPRIHTAH